MIILFGRFLLEEARCLWGSYGKALKEIVISSNRAFQVPEVWLIKFQPL